MSQVLINSDEAVNSNSFSVLRPNVCPSVVVSGLTGAEKITLQVNQNGTWVDVYVNGNIVQLSTTNNMIPIDLTGNYRLTKGITTSTVIATLHSTDVAGV